MKIVFAAGMLAVSAWGGVLPVISGATTNRALEKTGFRLAGDAVYATTNCTPRFGREAAIDVAGHALEMVMREKSWDNTWLSGCRVDNTGTAPGRIDFHTTYGKLHVETKAWRGGPSNVLDVSRGRIYLRTFVDGPDCWTLRLGARGDETVMGGGVTGADPAKYGWSGPVELAGRVLFADDTREPAGGWGCVLAGPVSGDADAVATLSRAFCLRLAGRADGFRGKWLLRGGGDGTYRCRLDAAAGSSIGGREVELHGSDLRLDGGTVFALPRLRCLSGDCRVEGGAADGTIGSIYKTGPGVLTLDTPMAVTGLVRVVEGTLAVAPGMRRPRIDRLVCLPGTTMDLGGADLEVGELTGALEVRGGRLTARVRKGAGAAVNHGPSVLEELRAAARAKSFFWAWTEEWTTWGSVSEGEWPRFRTRIGALTGRLPRVMYYDLGTMTGSRMDRAAFADHARVMSEAIRTHWRACRGIPVFSWHMDHPCTTNGFPQAWYRYKCKEHPHVIRDILDGTKYPCGIYEQWTKAVHEPCPSPRDWYFRSLDDIAAFFNRLVDDDGNRIPVVLRYGHEMDGAWFWWGKGWCTPDEFVRFSRMTADYLRSKCGRDALLFAYTPDRTWKELGAEGDGGANFLSWYPGDAYVDVLGFDDYSIGKGAGEKAEANFAETLRKLRLVSAFAREHGKIAAITETGCKDANDDFWTRLLRLGTADGVEVAFADTWGGPWTMPAEGADAQRADLLKFVADPAVLTEPAEKLARAASAE